MKKKRYLILISFCFVIVLLGFITISANMPKFIKDRSDFSINCSASPFDISLKTNTYSIYINSKVFTKVNNSIKTVFNNAGSKVKNEKEFISSKISVGVKKIKKLFYKNSE